MQSGSIRRPPALCPVNGLQWPDRSTASPGRHPATEFPGSNIGELTLSNVGHRYRDINTYTGVRHLGFARTNPGEWTVVAPLPLDQEWTFSSVQWRLTVNSNCVTCHQPNASCSQSPFPAQEQVEILFDFVRWQASPPAEIRHMLRSVGCRPPARTQY